MIRCWPHFFQVVVVVTLFFNMTINFVPRTCYRWIYIITFISFCQLVVKRKQNLSQKIYYTQSPVKFFFEWLPLSKHFLLALAQADMRRCQVLLSLRILKNTKFLHSVRTHPPVLRRHHGTRNIQQLGHYLGAGPRSRRDVRVFFQRRESLLVSSLCARRPCVGSQSLPQRCRHAPAQRSRQPYLISSGGWFTQTQWRHHLLSLLVCQFSPQPPPPTPLGVGCEGDGDKWCVTTRQQWQPSDRCVSLCA